MSVKKEVITEQFEEKKANVESMEEPMVVVKKVSRQRLENKSSYSIEFVDSIYIDDQFVVVEKKNNNWFMVSSLSVSCTIHLRLILGCFPSPKPPHKCKPCPIQATL